MAIKITSQNVNFSKWYQDICEQANLALHSPVKGMIIFEPYAFAIWERIKLFLDTEFKNNGVSNILLPTLIPESLFEVEKEHVKGFFPEVFTVSNVGNKTLKEKLIIRPTSEILFSYYFSQRIQSYNQLPMKLNQWCTVLRSEKNTKPFLRTSEFMWQEGHTSHSTAKEAIDFTDQILDIYNNFINKILLIPTLRGEKTDTEKFSGAKKTLTIETIMKDGQALQTCTSHYLEQNFSKLFNIKFINKDQKQDYVYQTSWGLSSRIIGAIIMNHGDDRGLVLPPKIAPYEIVILELFGDKDSVVRKATIDIESKLNKNYRLIVDRSNKTIGYKSQQWEVKGVPIRIEIGPRDLKQKKVILVNRLSSKKREINIDEILKEVELELKIIEKTMQSNSSNTLKNKLKKVSTYEELKKEIKLSNIVEANILYSLELEKKIKNETFATIRCIIKYVKNEKCIITKKEANMKVIFAKAY